MVVSIRPDHELHYRLLHHGTFLAAARRSRRERAPAVGQHHRVPDVRRNIEPIPQQGATPVTLNLEITQRPDLTFEYVINGVPFMKGHDIQAKSGETQIWTLVNKTKWSHPFHLHGFFFQQLDKDGQPKRPLVWKDTIDVPFEETAMFIVKYDDRPGTWMTHCHILDHAEGGLMGMVRVAGNQ